MQSLPKYLNPMRYYRRIKHIVRPHLRVFTDSVEDYPSPTGSPVFVHCPHGGEKDGMTTEVRSDFRMLIKVSARPNQSRRGG
jgi:hypothetical protein